MKRLALPTKRSALVAAVVYLITVFDSIVVLDGMERGCLLADPHTAYLLSAGGKTLYLAVRYGLSLVWTVFVLFVVMPRWIERTLLVFAGIYALGMLSKIVWILACAL